MPKIWDLMPQVAKTKVMAYRHYLEKKENKGGLTMRREDGKLVFEQGDLNTILVYSLKDNQFHHHNEIPEVMVIEVPACVTGKDRNSLPLAVPIEVIRVANSEGALPPAPEPLKETGVSTAPNGAKVETSPEPALEKQGGADGTQPEEATEAGSENEPAPVADNTPLPKANKIPITQELDDYFCTECKRVHVSGGKIHKRHLKHKQ